MTVLPLFIAALCIRLISLFVSVRNERKLKKEGAVEYGKINSIVLTISHIAFYLLCLWQGIRDDAHINQLSLIGSGLFCFSMIMLYLVIRELGDVWTIKLIIARNHPLNKSVLFRFIRHPNYFLNVIPELISIAMICQAWTVLVIGLPLYMIPLGIRIYQEEAVMKQYVKGF
jgi:isoprenylcysteine carboxyl methyltransferase (ICMT) family protein YpbQ